MSSPVTRAAFRVQEAIDTAPEDVEFRDLAQFIEYGFSMAIQYVREEQAADQRRRRKARR